MNNPSEAVRDALERMQLGVNELRHKCARHFIADCEICMSHQNAMDTVRAHITALAAEVEGLRVDLARDGLALDAALDRAKLAEAKLAACEALIPEWRDDGSPYLEQAADELDAAMQMP